MLRTEKLKIGARQFKWGERTYLMGILNLTPDSFSGDGIIPEEDEHHPKVEIKNIVNSALDQALKFIEAGADILDVGGESTRPGATQVDAVSELERVVPVIEALVKEFDIPVSVDTYKHQVAQKAIEAGASLVNDVWGFQADSIH